MDPIERFLETQRSDDVGRALDSLQQVSSGTRTERIARLLALRLPLTKVLETFTTQALREACSIFGVPAPSRKPDLVTALLAHLESYKVGATGTAPLMPPMGRGHSHAQRLPATMAAVQAHLSKLAVIRPSLRDESDVRRAVLEHVRPVFEHVQDEYKIGTGYLQQRIDIDIGNGTFGIEAKLASELTKAANVHRAIGQAVYYRNKKYGPNLLIAIAGRDATDANVNELREYLRDLGIETMPIFYSPA